MKLILLTCMAATIVLAQFARTDTSDKVLPGTSSFSDTTLLINQGFTI
jgi:hypothetical protein